MQISLLPAHIRRLQERTYIPSKLKYIMFGTLNYAHHIHCLLFSLISLSFGTLWVVRMGLVGFFASSKTVCLNFSLVVAQLLCSFFQEKHSWSVWEPHCLHSSWALPSCAWHWCFWSKVQYCFTWSRYVHLFSLLREGKKTYSLAWVDRKAAVWSWAEWWAYVSFLYFHTFDVRELHEGIPQIVSLLNHAKNQKVLESFTHPHYFISSL